jgi:hypothetical protein
MDRVPLNVWNHIAEFDPKIARLGSVYRSAPAFWNE